MVAKEGGITQASEVLQLAQPTLSTQIQKLEKSLGVKLFERKRRALVLTDTGQMVFRYADEIFNLGRELTDTLRGRASDDSIRLLVGVPDVLPKLIVYNLLKPALALEKRVKLVCHEGKLKDLLIDLAQYRLDLVLADSPLTPQVNVKAFNHLLGECGITIFGTAELAKKYKRGFPGSLNGAPMLLPTQTTALRRSLEQWFDDQEIRPDIIHEFDDSAILKIFGQLGEGLIALSSVIEKDVCEQYSLKVVGRIPELTERFYAISVERRLKHPAIVAITENARENLFTKQ